MLRISRIHGKVNEDAKNFGISKKSSADDFVQGIAIPMGVKTILRCRNVGDGKITRSAMARAVPEAFVHRSRHIPFD
jgi:hypothetical protein